MDTITFCAAAGGHPMSGFRYANKPRPVMVVDGQLSVAQLLAASIEATDGLTCVGVATSAEQALALGALLAPAVVVVGMDSLGTSGLRVVRALAAGSSPAAVVVLSGETVGDWLPRAASAGAAACAVRGGSLADLITTIRTARRGSTPVAPQVLRCPTSHSSSTSSTSGASELTLRESEVLGYLGMGLQAKAIASLMGISVHTCRGYIKVVYAKLHVSNRIEAVNAGVELHLLSA